MSVHKVKKADAAELPWDDDSADLLVTSPPYFNARTYGINADRTCEEWIEWQLKCVKEMVRVCKGPVIYNVGGVTRDNQYWPGCEGLLYRAWKEGIHCYRPIIWHKKGIPGKIEDWVRNDIEYIFCFKRPGKLPYQNLEALKVPTRSKPGVFTNRKKDGTRTDKKKYVPKPLSNPGNVFKWHYSEKELAVLLNWRELQMTQKEQESQDYPGALLRIIAASNQGHPIAYDHEAPFPESLVAWFVTGWCPPDGTVCDPFVGSGTVPAVAQQLGRNSISSDLRRKCVRMTESRLATPWLRNKSKAVAAKGGLFEG